MHLVQILRPIDDPEGREQRSGRFDAIAQELLAELGGWTTHPRAPARGAWRSDAGREQRDDPILYEVLVDELDVAWWAAYRLRLEMQFQQVEIAVLAIAGARRRGVCARRHAD